MMNKFAYLYFVLLFLAILGGCKSDGVSTMAQEKSVQEKIKEASSIEEVETLLNGTAWHYTENLNTSNIGFWVKVEFSNGQFNSYYAEPSDGKWTSGGSGNYSIEEGRFSNSGEKYIAVIWEAKGYKGLPFKYAFIPNNLQFSVQSMLPSLSTFRLLEPDYGIMEFGDYSWN